jgi:hypothetical protein
MMVVKTMEHYKVKKFAPEFLCLSELSGQYLTYGDVYKDAVDHLIKGQEEDGGPHAYGVLPILYVFHHYVELKLKGLILYKCLLSGVNNKDESEGMKKDRHNLNLLWDRLKKLYQDMPIQEDAEKFILDFGKLDHDAAYFRYPESKKGKRFIRYPKGTENYDRNSRTISKDLHDKMMDLNSLKQQISLVTEYLFQLEAIFDGEKIDKQRRKENEECQKEYNKK